MCYLTLAKKISSFFTAGFDAVRNAASVHCVNNEGAALFADISG